MTDELLDKLVSKFPNLVTINLSNTQLSAQQVEKLLKLTNLRFLNLSKCSIGADEAKELAEALKENTTLRALDLQQWPYDYGLALELSICAYWIGKYEECQQICRDLLRKRRPSRELSVVHRKESRVCQF